MATSSWTNHGDQFPPYSCTLANGLLCVDCKEAQSLEDQIKILEAKRRQLGGRLNARHDTLTSRLPVEVMSNIFLNFMEDSDGQSDQTESLEWYDADLQNYDNHWIPSTNGAHMHEGPFRVREPLQLGSICRSWRAIAWSTPQLWTTIAVDIGREDLDFVEQLAGRLARSRTLPLHILIHSSACSEIFEYPHLNPQVISIILVDQFLAHSSRWASLDIRQFPAAVVRYLHCDDGARPKLQDLAVSMSTTGKLTINASWDHLTRIIITAGMSFAQIDIDWTNLTHVSLSVCHFQLGEYFKVLALARRLTHFRVLDPFSRGLNPQHEKIGLQHNTLQHLDLCIESTLAAEILRYAAFPVLESYRYQIGDAYLDTHEVIGHTFRLNSGKSLKRLTVHESNSQTSCHDLITVLKALPALEYLDLDILRGGRHYFDPLFELLFSSTSTLEAPTEMFLPNLKELWLRNWKRRSWTLVPQIFGQSTPTHISNSSDIQTHPVNPEPHQRPLRFLGMDGFASGYDPIDSDTIVQFMSLMDKGITFRIGDFDNGEFYDMLDYSIYFHHLSH